MEVSPDQLEEANYHDLLDRLLAYREKLMSTPPQNRKARIYHQKYEVKEDKFAELDIEAAF